MGSVSGVGAVGLTIDGNKFSLNFPPLLSRTDVILDNGAFIDVRAGGGGSIAINAKKLTVSNSSQINAGIKQGMGNASSLAGDININATELVNLTNSSLIFNGVEGVGKGKGGNINITARSLSAMNGSQITASTSGQGDAGSVIIHVSDRVSFDEVDSTGVPSGAYSSVNQGAVGNAGNINITASSLSVTNGAQLQSLTEGQGNAGNVIIHASDTVSFDGSSAVLSGVGTTVVGPSTALSGVGTTGVGLGGNIDISARSLFVTNGAELRALTRGQGDAGNILVNVTDFIEIAGASSLNGASSGLFASTEQTASGNGGLINLQGATLRIENGGVLAARSRNASKGGNIIGNVNNLQLAGGGEILTTAYGSGKAGNINFKVNNGINISGSDPTWTARFVNFGTDIVDPVSEKSGIFASTDTKSTGNGGIININTEFLNLDSGANISVSTSGTGNAGNVSITSRSLNLNNGAQLSAQTTTSSTGDSGSISLNTTNLNIDNGANISVNSTGKGNAGNLKIDSRNINLDQQASLLAGTASGEGGNISIQTGSLMMRHNSPISADARTGANNSTGNGGNITINATNTITALETSPITANANLGRGGNIQIATQGLFNSPDSPITASSGNPQLNGVVNITILGFSPSNSLTQFKGNAIANQQTIANSCLTSRNQQRGKFTVTGLDTLPITPFTNFDLWYALPPQPTNTTFQQKPTTLPPVATASKPWKIGDPIVEAQGIVHTKDGRIILTATPQNTTPESPDSLVCHPNSDSQKS